MVEAVSTIRKIDSDTGNTITVAAGTRSNGYNGALVCKFWLY